MGKFNSIRTHLQHSELSLPWIAYFFVSAWMGLENDRISDSVFVFLCACLCLCAYCISVFIIHRHWLQFPLGWFKTDRANCLLLSFFSRSVAALISPDLTWLLLVSYWHGRVYLCLCWTHRCAHVLESKRVCCQGLHQQLWVIIVVSTHFTLALPLQNQGAIKNGCLPQSTHPSTGTRHYLNPLIFYRDQMRERQELQC